MNILEIKKAKFAILREIRESGSIWNYADNSGNKLYNEAFKQLLRDNTLKVSKKNDNFIWYTLKAA